MKTLYEVRPSDGKGEGVLAKQAILSGTIVLSDQPVMLINKPNYKDIDVFKASNKLNASQET